MKYILFFFSFLTFTNLFSQDKTKADEYNGVSDTFLQRIRELPSEEKKVNNNTSSTENKLEPSMVNLEKRLIKESNQRKFYHELPFSGLKDSVHSLKITRYAVNKDAVKITTQTGNPIVLGVEITIFDENGYPEEQEEIIYKRGLKIKTSKISRYIGAQLFEQEEIDENGSSTILKYIGPQKYFDSYIRLKGNTKIAEYNCVYDEKRQTVVINSLNDRSHNVQDTRKYKNNLMVSREEKVASTLNYKVNYKYNSDNSIDEYTQVIVDTKPFARHYKYTKKDTHNNWTERVCLNDKKVPMWIEEVEYVYKYESPDFGNKKNQNKQRDRRNAILNEYKTVSDSIVSDTISH